MDDERSRIFVMCLSPVNANTPHIECLAAIGSILHKKQNIQKILNAGSSEEVYSIFKGL